MGDCQMSEIWIWGDNNIIKIQTNRLGYAYHTILYNLKYKIIKHTILKVYGVTNLFKTHEY